MGQCIGKAVLEEVQMEVVFNDIAAGYKFKNKYDAVEKMKTAIEVLISLRKQDPSFRLSSQTKVTGLEIASGYYFGQLFSEDNRVLSQNHKTALKTFFTNFNALSTNGGRFIYEGRESEQCGYAYENNGLIFSIGTKEDFLLERIKGEYWGERKVEEAVSIDNIAHRDHLNVHSYKLGIRCYEANPKHKVNYGWGSIMDLNEEEAQFILNKAVIAEDDEKHLIAKYKGKYYSFRCHWKNFYHGYLDNAMPEYMKRKLTEIDSKTY